MAGTYLAGARFPLDPYCFWVRPAENTLFAPDRGKVGGRHARPLIRAGPSRSSPRMPRVSCPAVPKDVPCDHVSSRQRLSAIERQPVVSHVPTIGCKPTGPRHCTDWISHSHADRSSIPRRVRPGSLHRKRTARKGRARDRGGRAPVDGLPGLPGRRFFRHLLGHRPDAQGAWGSRVPIEQRGAGGGGAVSSW